MVMKNICVFFLPSLGEGLGVGLYFKFTFQ